MKIANHSLFFKVILHRLIRGFRENPVDKTLEDFLLSLSDNKELKSVIGDKQLAKIYGLVVGKIYALDNFRHLYTGIITPGYLKHINKLNLYAKRSFY